MKENFDCHLKKMKYLVKAISANCTRFNFVTGQDKLRSFKIFQLKFKYHAQIHTPYLCSLTLHIQIKLNSYLYIKLFRKKSP